MSDSTKDRVTGHVDEAKGKAKSAVGDVTGDDQMKTEGQADQLTGKVKQGVADLKDKANDVVKGLTGDKDKKD
jgi:uncharacterized protein YjbJ (UPF0337 family)